MCTGMHRHQDTASARTQSATPPPPLHVLRSSQLDAARLDTELTSLLGEQLSRVFASFNPGRVLEWDAEINAVLNLLVFGASVWHSPTAATPGSVLLNLKYRSEDSPGSALLPPVLQQLIPWHPKRRGHVRKHATSNSSPGSKPAQGGLLSSKNSSSSSSSSNSSSSSSSSSGVGPAHRQPPMSSIPLEASTPGEAATFNEKLKQGIGMPFMHTAVPRLPFDSGQAQVGGRTGVDGPPLSITQRLLLVAGIVVLPYLWSRLGQRLASAAAQGSDFTRRGQSGWRQRVAATPHLIHRLQPPDPHSLPAPHSPRAHVPLHSHTSSAGNSRANSFSESCHLNQNRAGVLGAILSKLGLGSLVSMASAWLGGWTEALGETWQRASNQVQWVQGQGSAWLGWRVMRAAETAFRGAALLNFLAFLAGGKYRSLLERLAGARLVYEQPHMTRVISFEYLNRQLVWREISELLLLLLPLLDAAKFRRNLSRLMPRLPSPAAAMQHLYTRRSEQERPIAGTAVGAGTAAARVTREDCREGDEEGVGDAGLVGREGREAPVAEQQQQQQQQDQEHVDQRPRGPCPICGTREILQAVVAQPCGHVFCYYCLSASCTADRWYECPLDGVRVASMKRWRPVAK